MNSLHRCRTLVDGGLPRDARAKLEAHLAACADCRALLADLKRVKSAARALPKMTAPESVWQNVRAGLDAEARHPGDRRPATVLPFAPWRWRGLTGLAAAAVVVLAVTAGTYFMTRPATPADAGSANRSARKRRGRRPIG